jgi:CheY-like chemotaxis protein
MKTLQQVRILFASDGPADTQLFVWLRSEGAQVDSCSWTSALAAFRRSPPDVLVADLRVERANAEQQLRQLKTGPTQTRAPIVALIPRSTSTAALPSSELGVNKYVTTPLHPADLINALAALGVSGGASVTSEQSRSEVFQTMLQTHAERRDLRSLLRLVNATGPFRYTAILRFDDDKRLTSVWTFDREAPDVDSFPVDKSVEDSYCARVLETSEPFLMPDAALDPSVQNHPARHSVLSYCGVPLIEDDGSVFGTLCQFDVTPRFFQPSTVERLSAAATVLRGHLATLNATREPLDASPRQAPAEPEPLS